MSEQQCSIGFIGIGVLGKGLALALASRGYDVVAASSRSAGSARWLSDRLPRCRVFRDAQDLADACDLVFITTPDSVIEEVAAALSWRPGQGAVHCCGAVSTRVLDAVTRQGGTAGAFHPFQTFSGLQEPEEAATRLTGVTFAVAGEGWLEPYLSVMAQNLGGMAVSIDDKDRPLYHAAAVLGCGFFTALLQDAVLLWKAMGFSDEQAIRALYPLAKATLDNAEKMGTVDSVTGPVVRGDAVTVQAHLEALASRLPEVIPVYQALAMASLPLAEARAVAPAQVEALRQLFETLDRRSAPWHE